MTKKRKIVNICIWISIIIIVLVGYSLPFEKWFIRFNTMEDAWNSTKNRGKEIISTTVVDNVAFVTYIDNASTIASTYIIKDNKGWIPPIRRFYDFKNYIMTNDNYYISYWYDSSKNIITIDSAFFEDKNKLEAVVKDSINTSFKHDRIKFDNFYTDRWYAVIDNLPEDYKIIINDK